MIRRPPSSTLFPSPTLSRSRGRAARASAPPPPQQQEAVGEDVAHDVTDFVERAGEQALRGALTQRERHVAHMIPRAAGEERPQRVDHRLLETGDGRHGGEPERETVEVALGKKADWRKGGQNEYQDG